MRSEVVGGDLLTGTRRILHTDYIDDKLTVETQHDVTDIVESNKELYNDATDARFKGDHHLVARIPLPLYFDLIKQGIYDPQDPNSKRFRAWLNDNSNQVFRTRPGRI